jgi:hypothetical protein
MANTSHPLPMIIDALLPEMEPLGVRPRTLLP